MFNSSLKRTFAAPVLKKTDSVKSPVREIVVKEVKESIIHDMTSASSIEVSLRKPPLVPVIPLSHSMSDVELKNMIRATLIELLQQPDIQALISRNSLPKIGR